MTSMTTATPIEALWGSLRDAGHTGGAIRVDADHSCHLYAMLDVLGAPGLVLITPDEPPAPTEFAAVHVTVNRRQDGRWALGIWLQESPLAGLFGRLCQDLVEASREVDPRAAAGFILNRMVRWRRLLNSGGSSALSVTEIRGLVGELTVLLSCLDRWPPSEVVRGWVGPLEAPQDFVLPQLRIEAKSITPGTSTVRISSAAQLDVADARLLLTVVTLASTADQGLGVSLASLVGEVRSRLHATGATPAELEFESRLAAAGYSDTPQYEQIYFRIEAIRTFEVRTGFPRLRRLDLPHGVREATYDVDLTVCEPFLTELNAGAV